MEILRVPDVDIERLQWVRSHPELVNPDRRTKDADGVGIDRADAAAGRVWERMRSTIMTRGV